MDQPRPSTDATCTSVYIHLCESRLESLSALNPCQHHYSTSATNFPPGFAHLVSHPSTGSRTYMRSPECRPAPPRTLQERCMFKGVQRQPGTGTAAQSQEAECVVNACFTDATLFLPFHFVHRSFHSSLLLYEPTNHPNHLFPRQTNTPTSARISPG